MKTATERAERPEAEPSLPAADPDTSTESETASTEPPSTDASWVDRCQRQFDDSDRRLRNLVDDENCAFYDGI